MTITTVILSVSRAITNILFVHAVSYINTRLLYFTDTSTVSMATPLRQSLDAMRYDCAVYFSIYLSRIYAMKLVNQANIS